MSNKIKKIIEQDINNNYKVEYNKEELYKNFIPKNSKNTIYITKLKLALNLIIVCIIGLIIGCTVTYITDYNCRNDDVITEEFREFVSEYGFEIKEDDKYAQLMISNKNQITIFKKLLNADDKEYIYYFYTVAPQKITIDCNMIVDYKIIKLDKEEFGLLEIKESTDLNQTLEFSIEIDGKIKQFILN